jgi:flagellar biosynthesis protein FlhG
VAEQTTIIPIAGGKGGVGKSFVTANLAVALAKRAPTIVVDLDLGNSNLHTFLGIENRYPGVGEFLRGTIKCAPDELVLKTKVPQLGFVPGDGRVPFMANITYAQKRTLSRLVNSLSARYVLLDLSAGTSFNTLDLFLTSSSGIIVTTAEHPAIMGALVFLKNLLLRAFDVAFKGESDVKDKLNEMYKQSVAGPAYTIERFRSEVGEVSPELEHRITEICQSIRPRFVYNMVDSLADTTVFERIETTLDEVLSLNCDHMGLIPFDPAVREALKQPGVFALQFPDSPTARAIERLAIRVVNYWGESIDDSARLLTNYAHELFLADHKSS